ncbi:MAG: hypothetical protein WC703_04205 [Candidatus Neomarinimicrobiota bacterium]
MFRRICTKLLFLSVMLILTATASAQGRIYFDIKTSLNDKADLLPIELATTLILAQSRWAGALEIGEDYTLFLKNYQRTERAESALVVLDVELREKSDFRTGKLLKAKRIKLKIDASDQLNQLQDAYQVIRNGLRKTDVRFQSETLSLAKAIEIAAWQMVMNLPEK